MLRSGQLLFTYLHLAPNTALTQGLIASGATCIAYETVEDSGGRLPLLAPMSEIAGKIATQAGAFMLEKPLGGRGLLLRDLARDHPLRPHIRDRRDHPLLRRQHAGRGADHLNLGADQRDHAVRGQAR